MPTLTPIPIVLSNGWHRRIYTEAGFQFDYPANSILSAGKNKGQIYDSVSVVFNLPNVDGYQGLSIEVKDNFEKVMIEEYVDQLY